MARRLVLSIAALMLLAAACTGSGGTTSGSGSGNILPSPSALNATTAPLLPTDRFALPEFDYGKFQTLLSQLKGKAPVVVNIWASWCGPCRIEAPHLAAAARQFGNRVQFIGVDIIDSVSPAQQFIRDSGWLYPSVFDSSGSIRDGFGLEGQPHTLFFARDGSRVSVQYGSLKVDAISGPIPADVLDAAVRQLLAT